MQVIERQSAKWIRPVEYTAIAKCLALGLPLSSHPSTPSEEFCEILWRIAVSIGLYFLFNRVCLADGFGVAVEHP